MSALTPHLTRRLTLLFALASGVIIANIYYSQPLLAAIASTFGYSPARLLDVGVQGLHISNQGVMYALAPDARSRITTIYLTCYFIGGAIGSSAASVAYYKAGWLGVCVAGALFSTLLIFSWLAAHRQGRRLCLQ